MCSETLKSALVLPLFSRLSAFLDMAGKAVAIKDTG